MRKRFNDLYIEMTRNCNLECDHCLRGCIQYKNITTKIIDSIIDEVDSIGSLTLTGGEPLLVPKLLIYIIDEIMRRRIPVGSFYIVSNGTIFNKDVFFKLIEFYWYCEDEPSENTTGFSVSIDEFHDNHEYGENIQKWKSLIFYSEAKQQTFNYQGIIDEGTANEYGIGTRSLILNDSKFEIELEEDNIYIEDMVYINVFGQILNDCDMSYQTQDDHVLGTIQANDYYMLED